MQCDYVAKGETAEEVKADLMKHASTVHADAMEAMTDEEKADMSQKADDMLAA